MFQDPLDSPCPPRGQRGQNRHLLGSFKAWEASKGPQKVAILPPWTRGGVGVAWQESNGAFQTLATLTPHGASMGEIATFQDLLRSFPASQKVLGAGDFTCTGPVGVGG